VNSIKDINHPIKERLSRQMTLKLSHTILEDGEGDKVRILARNILLAAASKGGEEPSKRRMLIPTLTPMNGMGHFTLPLLRLHFIYCSHADTVLKQYLARRLISLAKEYPSVEWVVECRWASTSLIRATYLRGYTKVIAVDDGDVESLIRSLIDSSGLPLRKFRQTVKSTADSVRPVLWSPFSSS
jgi:hypothetical protein